MHYLSTVVVVAMLLVLISQPLHSSSSSSSQLVRRDHLDALNRLRVLQTWLETTNDDADADVGGWRRSRRSDPPEWLGTHAAGTAWDAYVRMLRQQQQLDLSEQPRRTINPVNFLGKRAVFSK